MKWSGTDENAEAAYKKFENEVGKPLPKAAAPAAPKEEAKQPAKPKAAPVKKEAPAKKPPSRTERGKLVDYMNYGKETIHIKAEEVSIGSMFNFYTCEGTKIIIEGKCKSVLLNKCKKVDITVNELISSMEIIKSDATKVKILTKCPTLSVELCN